MYIRAVSKGRHARLARERGGVGVRARHVEEQRAGGGARGECGEEGAGGRGVAGEQRADLRAFAAGAHDAEPGDRAVAHPGEGDVARERQPGAQERGAGGGGVLRVEGPERVVPERAAATISAAPAGTVKGRGAAAAWRRLRHASAKPERR